MGAERDLGPGRLLGGDRYVLLRILGRGAMGAVYVGKQRALGKIVAIKLMVIDLAKNPAGLKRFYNEGRNAALLEHPNNVRVFDFGHEHDDLVYLVMELVRGEPLSHLLQPMPVPRALRIGCQVCRALAEAHAVGLVHRDLKPDNVMITHLDGDDFVRVLDYGIAKLVHSTNTNLTRTGMMVGTPRYLSPEQAVGHAVDARSDIYSLGAMLFEMVTGQPVFQAPNPVALAVAHVHKAPRRPGTVVTLPPQLDELIFRMLSKKPEQRPESADSVRHELEAILAETSSGAVHVVETAQTALGAPIAAAIAVAGDPVSEESAPLVDLTWSTPVLDASEPAAAAPATPAEAFAGAALAPAPAEAAPTPAPVEVAEPWALRPTVKSPPVVSDGAPPAWSSPGRESLRTRAPGQEPGGGQAQPGNGTLAATGTGSISGMPGVVVTGPQATWGTYPPSSASWAGVSPRRKSRRTPLVIAALAAALTAAVLVGLGSDQDASPTSVGRAFALPSLGRAPAQDPPGTAASSDAATAAPDATGRGGSPAAAPGVEAKPEETRSPWPGPVVVTPATAEPAPAAAPLPPDAEPSGSGDGQGEDPDRPDRGHPDHGRHDHHGRPGRDRSNHREAPAGGGHSGSSPPTPPGHPEPSSGPQRSGAGDQLHQAVEGIGHGLRHLFR